MFDALIQDRIHGPLNRVGRYLAQRGVRANRVTLAGAATAAATVVALGAAAYPLALGLLGANRLLDGLDGAVARASGRTDMGGYLDITSDYVFYAGVPLGFALADPERNALPAAALLASFLLTCSTFLASAALIGRQNPGNTPPGEKAFFYSRGLMEGAETIAFFVTMTLWPERFPVLAWVFSGLCLATALQRTLAAMASFDRSQP